MTLYLFGEWLIYPDIERFRFVYLRSNFSRGWYELSAEQILKSLMEAFFIICRAILSFIPFKSPWQSSPLSLGYCSNFHPSGNSMVGTNQKMGGFEEILE